MFFNFCRQGAAEVRKAVSSTVYAPSDLARSVSGLNLTVSGNLWKEISGNRTKETQYTPIY